MLAYHITKTLAVAPACPNSLSAEPLRPLERLVSVAVVV